MADRRETVLITGASSGIGLELARIFAKNSYDLILVARREAELQSLAQNCRIEYGSQVHVFPMDLLVPDASAKLVGQLKDSDLEVDILVNNAGLMDMGRFAEIEVDRHERLLQLNIVVLTSLTRLLLPAMIRRGRGRIMNVASTSSFQPVPSMALYAASKAFVLSTAVARAFASSSSFEAMTSIRAARASSCATRTTVATSARRSLSSRSATFARAPCTAR